MKNNLILALVACLTLGLAPFSPEPHIYGKLKWILGGADGMQMVDYLDLLMHGAPWVWFIYEVIKMIKKRTQF